MVRGSGPGYQTGQGTKLLVRSVCVEEVWPSADFSLELWRVTIVKLGVILTLEAFLFCCLGINKICDWYSHESFCVYFVILFCTLELVLIIVVFV